MHKRCVRQVVIQEGVVPAARVIMENPFKHEVEQRPAHQRYERDDDADDLGATAPVVGAGIPRAIARIGVEEDRFDDGDRNKKAKPRTLKESSMNKEASRKSQRAPLVQVHFRRVLVLLNKDSQYFKKRKNFEARTEDRTQDR